jgi:PAS domain S-box-containing protein
MKSLPRTVLCIDDEIIVRSTVNDYLTDMDYTVFEAESGMKGFDLYKKKEPSVVLLDIHMPDINGIELITLIREHDPDAAIIVVSGAGEMQLAIDALRLGAWDYLQKPIEDLAILEHSIQKALDKAALIKENRMFKERLVDLVHKRTEELTTLATAIEQAGDMVVMTDVNGIIEYVNPAFEEISGYSKRDAVGKSAVNFGRDESNKVDSEVLEAMTNGQLWRGSIVNKKKNGQIYEVESTISPVKDSEGEIANFVILQHDITHEVALEKQLREAQKMEAIGTLSGGIAHDFNNILYIILGYAELVQDEVEPDSKISSMLEEIVKAGKRGADLVKHILTFSRRGEEERKPVKIQFIAKEVLKMLRGSIPSTINIGHNIANVRPVLADPTQIHQVLMNLCTNAYHAMKADGGKLFVSIEEVFISEDEIFVYDELTAGPYVLLKVRDTGHGIDEINLERVFEPYFTTRNVAKGEGTGLGLSVVHGIVTAHKGHIKVDSKPGEGTCFSIYLPISKDDEADVLLEHKKTPLQGAKERIMLIDDEEQVVEMTELLLQRSGYKVTSFTDSIEAYRIFTESPDDFDVVVTDQTMPNLTGLELSKKILRIRKDTPIVICSGYSESVNEEICSEWGIKAYVSKPIIIKDLVKTIQDVLP